MTDRELMELAIAQAKLSEPEDDQIRPRVGVVFSRDGNVLATAYRNEDGKGSHAEYLALEKLRDKGIDPTGSTVFTTLEPCTQRRSSNKTPCAQRLIDARVAKVVWGIIDPHKTVQSKGILRLRMEQIETESFPHALAREIEGLNQHFIEAYTLGVGNQDFINRHSGRSLNKWYETINQIYWLKNVQRSPFEIFGHLVETIAGMSSFETGKHKTGVNEEAFGVKAIAWWLALCGRVGIDDGEQMLWAKFPSVCTYCRQKPHTASCKDSGQVPDWTSLQQLGDREAKPKSIGEWQLMFRDIYPNSMNLESSKIFAYLSEEIGELGEAVRVFDLVPGLFLNEAPDVFAWIMQVQNMIERNFEEPGKALEIAFCSAFPDVCGYCAAEKCECPAILPSTVGRLGGSIPPTDFSINGETKKAFLTVDVAAQRFGF